MGDRSAILINCSRAESEVIHEEAQMDRRSISGYVLKIVMGQVYFEENMVARAGSVARTAYLAPWKRPIQMAGPRATFLIRCSHDESERIRAAAKRRDISISGYVLNTIRRTWKVQTAGGASGPSEDIQGISFGKPRFGSSLHRARFYFQLPKP